MSRGSIEVLKTCQEKLEPHGFSIEIVDNERYNIVDVDYQNGQGCCVPYQHPDYGKQGLTITGLAVQTIDILKTMQHLKAIRKCE
jgi:hypothetical protein